MPTLLHLCGHITKENSRLHNSRLLDKRGYNSFCRLTYKDLHHHAYFVYHTPDSPFFRPASTVPEKFLQTNVKCAQKQNPRYGVDRLITICQVYPEMAAVMIRCILMGGYPGTICTTLQQRKYLLKQTDEDLAKKMYHLLRRSLNKSDIMLFTVAFGHILLNAFHLSTKHLLYRNLVPFCEWFARLFFSGLKEPRPVFPDQVCRRQLHPNPLMTLIRNTTLHFELVDVSWPISKQNWEQLGMSQEGVAIFNSFMFGHISFMNMKTNLNREDSFILGCIVGTLFYSLPKVTPINQDSRKSFVVFCMHCRTINSAVNIHNKRVRDKLTPLVDLNNNDIVCSICLSKHCSIIQLAGNSVTFPTASVPMKNKHSILEIHPTTKIMCPRCCRMMNTQNKICRMCQELYAHNLTCHYFQRTLKKRQVSLSSVIVGGRHLVLCRKHKQQVFSGKNVSGYCN